MNFQVVVFLCGLIGFGAPTILHAESVPLPSQSINVSASKNYSVHINPPTGLTRRQFDYLYLENYATLHRLFPDIRRESLVTWISLYKNVNNKEELVWERPISQAKVTPKEVHVADSGLVVTLGEGYGGCDGDSSAVVIYDGAGDVLKHYALSDLFDNVDPEAYWCSWWETVRSSIETKDNVGGWAGPDEADTIVIEISEGLRKFCRDTPTHFSFTINGREVKFRKILAEPKGSTR